MCLLLWQLLLAAYGEPGVHRRDASPRLSAPKADHKGSIRDNSISLFIYRAQGAGIQGKGNMPGFAGADMSPCEPA